MNDPIHLENRESFCTQQGKLNVIEQVHCSIGCTGLFHPNVSPGENNPVGPSLFHMEWVDLLAHGKGVERCVDLYYWIQEVSRMTDLGLNERYH